MPLRQYLVAAVTASLLAGCSPFLYLNTFSPAEQAREHADIAYGPLSRQKLDLFEPVNVRQQPAPVVVFFYGGGWDSGSKADYRFVGRTLAAKGFIAVVPDYRVYPEVVFPRFVEDGALAVTWTLENASRFNGDPARIFLMGHSAGAHIAAMLALDASYLDAHAHSPKQLAGWIGLSGPYDFLPLQSGRLKNIFGDPAPRSTQPIEFVSAAAPPALLISGDADTTVIPRNTRRLAARLRQADVGVREIFYPDVGHGRTVAAFSTLADGLPVVDEVTRFIDGEYRNASQQIEAAR